MSINDLLKALPDVMEVIVKFGLLPLVGSLLGAWLTNYFFPFRLKRMEWKWQKELWAREFLFETVSRIHFIAEHYLNAEYTDKFSMSGQGLHEAHDEILHLVKKLHSEGHKLKLYLNKSNANIFERYLRDSQKEYDTAKESWNTWDTDDNDAITRHTENTISGQREAAARAIAKLR